MRSADKPIYALTRFLASLFVLFGFVYFDLQATEQVPTIAYLLVGGLNGVDLYNLYKSNKEESK